MFHFLVKYLGFLKHIPLLPQMVDEWMKLYAFFFRPWLLESIDEIKLEVTSWPDVELTLHKYGGLEFRTQGKEIGHIHSNGILDILFTRALKQQVIESHDAKEHHVFPRSGWISYYISSAHDKHNAIQLLRLSYDRAARECLLSKE